MQYGRGCSVIRKDNILCEGYCTKALRGELVVIE